MSYETRALPMTFKNNRPHQIPGRKSDGIRIYKYSGI